MHRWQRPAGCVSWILFVLLSAAPFAFAAKRPAARAPRALQPLDFKELSWRSVGPASMGGRISDLAVDERDPNTFYLATGTGGLFKTTNLGTTWKPVFDDQPVASIGAVALWPGNPSVVWVGTGEANSRNSSSWGNGVYRSNDGGGKWTHLGLAATHNIAQVVLDPADSNVAYVAALGHLWGDNPERGVFKTTDGGKSWSHVLKGDAGAGAVDLVMDPRDPRVLYAALYARRRTPWSYTSGGASGGIFRTRDGGRSWTKLRNGLPTVTGRIGLDVYRRSPGLLFAVVESGQGGQIQEFEDKSRTGGVFRSEDGGDHWTRVSAYTPRPFYYGQIRVQPNDSSRVYLLGTDLWVSDDGGATFRARGARNVHPDCHAMWIDPTDGKRLLLGTDGGLFLSHDRGASWDYLNNLAIGEFYNITLDQREPYRIYGGLQDNQTWGGPSRNLLDPESWLDDPNRDAITNSDWFCLGGGDGFHVAVDPTDPDLVYFESQGGYLQRMHLGTGRVRFLRPSNREGEARFRFNWNAPFQISPHDPTQLWIGGNHLFRLNDRGETWEIASPDLTTQDARKMVTGGSAAETHCTIVTLAESPRARGTVWAGTDDGKLWVTRDGGAQWTDLTRNLRGVPGGLYMSRIEASRHDPGTAYLAIDGHRSDVFTPFLLMTRDHGRTWSSIASDLPPGGPVKVVREDPVRPDLLYAGTEFGLYASFDRGRHWLRLQEGLPTVAVDDIAIHSRDHDLVIGTHGRSVFVLDDITPLQQWNPEVATRPATLFAPREARPFYLRPLSGLWGQRPFRAKNPPPGASLNYFVREFTGDGVSLVIADSTDKTVRTLTGPGTPGFHRVTWDLQREPGERIPSPEWSGQPEFVAAGRYTVKMSYGKAPEQKQTLEVRPPSGER
ncbi:MAG TPA: hypothetical protein VEY91_13025 [Candidatus Limnocylindria bacterium]|nr:hypothetical protein [Candidatus Limnocylindria bacterium]